MVMYCELLDMLAEYYSCFRLNSSSHEPFTHAPELPASSAPRKVQFIQDSLRYVAFKQWLNQL